MLRNNEVYIRNAQLRLQRPVAMSIRGWVKRCMRDELEKDDSHDARTLAETVADQNELYYRNSEVPEQLYDWAEVIILECRKGKGS